MSPNRQINWCQKFQIQGAQQHLTGFLHADEDGDGNLIRIAIDISKEGSMSRALLNGIAAAINIGLEHGITIDTYINEFRGWKFDPTGDVVFSDTVESASSILDYIAQELELSYGGRCGQPANPEAA